MSTNISASNQAKTQPPEIKTMVTLDPKIYAYTLPHKADDAQGWIKIGYTTRDDADIRIKEQAGPKVFGDYKKLWVRGARNTRGETFDDHAFHRFLQSNEIKRKTIYSSNEWFYFNGHPEKALDLYGKFVVEDYSDSKKPEGTPYTLRTEQEQAVQQTLDYFNSHNDSKPEFLWNAKPRFGKTLASYHLAHRLNAAKVLILTNRPSIANSWFDDYEKFIAGQTNYLFVSESDALKDKPCITRDEYFKRIDPNHGGSDHSLISFVSLQDLKGSKYFGDRTQLDKLQWVHDLDWDLLILDEAHEGVDTFKTDRALEFLTRKATLHLSGTPFKAIANNKFSPDQIFTWGYEDEQQAKNDWDYAANSHNPYEDLPKLNLFTYQMSAMMTDEVNRGTQVDQEEVPYYFDLNEFFAVNESGRFAHEESVIKFLDALTNNEKYPFSTPQLRDELKHTFWLLNRVASAKALAKLLKKHPAFGEYEIVIAAGDGRPQPTTSADIDPDDATFTAEANDSDSNEQSLTKVEKAIAEAEKVGGKTITLSVGQLTTGVTVPQWSAVLMLKNGSSPSLYMQAAFRAQNRYVFTDPATHELRRKENAYVFDFAPERTLILFNEFANNLKPHTADGKGTTQERRENLKTLLNFLPVIGEDDEGRMVELDAATVLAIPHKLKATEVVRHGFMSNFLFANISGIFAAPKAVIETLNKLQAVKDTKVKNDAALKTSEFEKIPTDENGKVDIPDQIIINTTDAVFGRKVFDAESIIDETSRVFENPASVSSSAVLERHIEKVAEQVAAVAAPTKEDLTAHFENIRNSDVKRAQEHIKSRVQQELKPVVLTYDRKKQELQLQAEQEKQQAATATEKAQIQSRVETELGELLQEQQRKEMEAVSIATAKAQQEAVKEQRELEAERKKKSVEDGVRDHLRGFSRTIPSFIMAYGTDAQRIATNGPLCLGNFDKFVPANVFEEVTGITVGDFLFLRDGGDYVDEESSETKHFVGHLFNETVFNESVQEFLDLKDRLPNWFDEDQTEDIFDYIPPQKTNQIFTPKAVVKKMVDILENENPGIFSNPDTTFIDLYTKSGLYVTELVKRLNKGLRYAFPDEQERLGHILRAQVFAVAPTEIIRNIAKSYIYGGLTDISAKNLGLCDLSPIVKKGGIEVQQTLNNLFSPESGTNMKFDVVIGNPPYQEELVGGTNQYWPIYQDFYEAGFRIADRVCLITPGRFLFNAGSTSKEWNQKMLADPHLKVSYYEQDSSVVFPNTDIKGGVVVIYRDTNKDYGAIETFTHFPELNSILEKVRPSLRTHNFSQIVSPRDIYNLTDKCLEDHPEIADIQSVGHAKGIRSAAFNDLGEVIYFQNKPKDAHEYVQLYGLLDRKRVYRWIRRDYLKLPSTHNSFEKWKVFITKSNGSGAIGEVLSSPLIGKPLIGHTQTFLSIGSFDTQIEAESCLKYVKSKFCRAMLGMLKITQDNTKAKWQKVPMQDFATTSDIDWTKPIPDIDQQLYRKYGLSRAEINFIEEKVQAMK